jgi:hypothetical protein
VEVKPLATDAREHQLALFEGQISEDYFKHRVVHGSPTTVALEIMKKMDNKSLE